MLEDKDYGARKVYLGVDPGVGGGIAVVGGGKLDATPMPGTDRDVLEWLLAAVLPDRYVAFAVLEFVRSSPQMGVTSAFTFGRAYGSVRMALSAVDIAYEEVYPRKWQKALSITPRKKDESRSHHKNRLKAKAQELFPGIKVTLATADALLLAEYCRRTFGGQL